MSVVNMHARPQAAAHRRAVFALGFRPFFLLAGLAAALLLPVWGIGFASGHLVSPYYGGFAWHAHEMLFGFAVAVIAGFLLTAVRNWTGIDTLRGTPLAALAALWLAGRVLPFVPGLPPLLLAVVDLAFLPALMLALAVPLLRSGQRHNLALLLVLAGLWAANLAMHLSALGTGAAALWPANAAVLLIVVLMAVIGGRVLPFFTERAVPGARTRRHPVLEGSALISLVGLLALAVFWPQPGATAALALLAAALHGLRLAGWFDARVRHIPILWVLHLGYAWIVVGLALYGLAALGLLAPSLAVHAFTAGAIGVLTLGMMARVALGHTGRPMQAAPATVWAFVLINLAAFARVALPLFAPGGYAAWIATSSLLWTAAFALFLWVYVPILLRPRVDGQPG